LEDFQFPIDAQNRLVFKFGETFKEVSEELIVLSSGTATINLFQYIYEFIAVQVPFKKLHPKFETNDSDEDVLVYGEVHDYFDEEEEEASDAIDSSDETNSPTEPIDPRFAALLKLKNNNLQ
jgi:uncharacterized metal-binding protein YceD (DUF177 family)